MPLYPSISIVAQRLDIRLGRRRTLSKGSIALEEEKR